MSRRGWDNLSAQYRARLQRSGTTRRQYESGASLRKARGHAQTPEHPGQGVSRPEFQPYYQQRQTAPQPTYDVVEAYAPTPGAHSDEVKQAIAQRVNQVFGDRHKYRNRSLDPDYPPIGYPPAPDDEHIMEILEMDDYEIEYYAIEEPEGWFLWYH